MSQRRRKPGSRSTKAAAASGPSGGAWFGDLVPAALFLLTFLLCCFPLRDTDVWWHLRTGELIWQRMTIPRVDWYTYTNADREWIDLHWGFQLAIAAVYHLTAVNGVIVFKALCYTAAVAIGWRASGDALPLWLKGLLWLPAVFLISGRAYERPEMLTMVFLAGSLWLIERAAHHPRGLWYFPLLVGFWTNCHALFVLGCIVWGAFFVESLVARVISSGRAGFSPVSAQPGVGRLGIVSLLIVAACLVNPYLQKGLLFPLVLFRKFSVERDFYSPRVGEFDQPLGFVTEMIQRYGWFEGLLRGLGHLYVASTVVLFAAALASFVLLLIRTRRWSVYRAILFLGFSYLGWIAVRNMSVFALVVTVMLCANAEQILRSPDAERSPALPRNLLADQFAVLCLGLLMLVAFSGGFARIGDHWKRFGFGEAPDWFAHDAVKFAGQPGMPQRAFVAHFGLAGTYIYHNGPDRKVFMDPRLEVCSRETFEQFEDVTRRIRQRQPGWEQILRSDAGELPAVILDSRYSRAEINGLLLTPTWRLVFADPSAGVFIPAPLAERRKLPRADPRVMFHPPD